MSSIVSCSTSMMSSDPSPTAVTALCSMFVSFLFISSKIVCIFSVVADVLVVMGLIVEVFLVGVGVGGAVGWTCSVVF